MRVIDILNSVHMSRVHGFGTNDKVKYRTNGWGWLLQVVNMTVRVKGKLLLENTDVNITAGRRYGLVGPNGMGKSTLLHLIMKRRVPVRPPPPPPLPPHLFQSAQLLEL